MTVFVLRAPGRPRRARVAVGTRLLLGLLPLSACFSGKLPEIEGSSVTTSEDVPVDITLDPQSWEMDGLTYVLVVAPTSGTLTAPDGGRVTYQPDPEWSGTDGFVWAVRTPGGTRSNDVSVEVTVAPVDDAPTAFDQALDTSPGQPVTITLRGLDPEGVSLACALGGVSVVHGALSLSDCDAVYTPDADFAGDDAFTFTVSDGVNTSAEATVGIHVAGSGSGGTNQTPSGVTQSVATPEDTSVTITLEGSDPDGDRIDFKLIADGELGDVALTGSQAVYTPDPDATGPDMFRYSVIDEHGAESEPVKVLVEVTDVPDLPETTDLSGTTPEDTVLVYTLTATDVDRGDRIEFYVDSAPAMGTASITGDQLTYTPPSDWYGEDSLQFRAVDSYGNRSVSSMFSVTVSSVNDAPVAVDAATATTQDTPVDIALSASDKEGDALTAVAAVDPANGTVTFSGMTARYTPDPGWFGVDTFTWEAYDGHDYAPATVTIEVIDVADNVTLSGADLATDEDVTVSTTLVSEALEGFAVVGYRVVAPPTLGTVAFEGDELVYTPTPNAHGTDTFTVSATDDAGGYSAAARFTVVIASVNDLPEAADAAVATNEDSPVSFPLSVTDVDGDSLSYRMLTAPEHGSFSRAGSVITYTPAAGYSGPDGFSWRASDGTGNSRDASVSLTVHAVNDLPAVAAASGTTNEDTPVDVTLSGTDDEDGTNLTYAVVSGPMHGVVTVSGTTASYTPNADWNGNDQFAFVATDTEGGISAPGVVAVTVAPVNDAPTPTLTSFSCEENGNTTVDLTATDPEGDAVTFTLATQPSHGRIVVTSPSIRYTPTANYDGTDTFSYTVSDGSLSSTGTVTVTVTDTTGTPQLTPGTATTNEDTAVTVTLTAYDPNGDTMTYSIVSQPTNGGATLAGTRVTYTPTANFNGTDVLRWRATDTTGQYNESTVTVTVNSVNDTPTVANANVTLNEDASSSFRLSCSDPDARTALSYSVVTQPEHGTLTVAAGNAQYRPSADYYGADSLQYTCSDGTATSAVATVSITVNSVADPPTVYASTLMTWAEHPQEFLPQWSDPDSSSVTFVLDDGPSNGTLVATTDGWEYTPNTDFHGRDRFTWHASDGAADSESVTSIIVVHPPTQYERPEMPQIGLNGIAVGVGATFEGNPYSASEQFWPTSLLDGFHELGAQMQRQINMYDMIWSVVSDGPNGWADPEDNEMLADRQVEPSVTLFEIQYASPTSPYCTDDAEFEKEMGEDAYAYLDEVMQNYGEHITSYEIGNEMYHWVAAAGAGGGGNEAEELPDCIPEGGYSDEEQGVFIYQAAQYIRGYRPDAVISLAAVNTDCDPCESWINSVATTGGSDNSWFDVVTYHGYDSWQRSLNTRDTFREMVDGLGLEDKLIRLTEMGSTSDEEYTERTNYPNSDESQSADVFRLALISFAGGTGTVIWHTYVPISEVDDGEFQGFQILNYDGTWKPAAYAFQLLTHDVLPIQQITEIVQNNKYAYHVIRTDGEDRWVMWGSRSVEVPDGVTEYTSVYPNADGTYTWTPVSPGDSLTLTATPYLFR